jgi:hypothetical protein
MKVDSEELLKQVQSLEVVEHDKQAAATLQQELRNNINELEEQLTEKNKVTASLNFPGEGDIFRTHPDQPWAHPASCTMGTGSFPGIKAPGA